MLSKQAAAQHSVLDTHPAGCCGGGEAFVGCKTLGGQSLSGGCDSVGQEAAVVLMQECCALVVGPSVGVCGP